MRMLRRIRAALRPAMPAAPGAVASELRFWDEYLQRRPACVGSAELRAQAFPPSLRACIEAVPCAARRPRVLELGPGPVSLLAAGVENGWFDLVAVDPLALEYAAMMQRHGLSFPVRPIAGAGESLLDVVNERSFDFAYSGNAIDHAADPGLCVRNLARAVRSGGRLVLEGFCHEGTNAAWEGLHQHDLVVENGHLVHYDRSGRRSEITLEMPGLHCVCHESGPFREKGLRWFGYEPETASGGTCGWFDFDWYTLIFEVRG